MAITGKYNFKGIELADAYVKVDNANLNHEEHTVESVKTAAVYNEDGSIKTGPVMETVITKSTPTSCTVRVYKDKATRDASFNDYVCLESFNFSSDLTADSKNISTQAYTHIKSLAAWSEFTDV